MRNFDYYSKYGTRLKKGTEDSVAFDIATPRDIFLPEGTWTQVDTGLTIYSDAQEPVWYMVVPRSSAGKYGIRIRNTIGVIDEDFVGLGDSIRVDLARDRHMPEVDPNGIPLFGLPPQVSADPLYRAGDYFAQLLILPYVPADLQILLEKPDLPSRGGFGSTGR